MTGSNEPGKNRTPNNRDRKDIVVPHVPELLKKAIEDKHCILFVGSGFSVDAGAPTWKGLFADLLDESRLKNAGLKRIVDRLTY